MNALTDFLRFLDDARLVVVKECESCEALFFACWHGGTTVNVGIVGPADCSWFDTWTNYDLPTLATHLTRQMLEDELELCLGICRLRDLQAAS